MSASKATVVLFLVLFCSLRGLAEVPQQLSSAELGNVLYCLNSKLPATGYAPPRFGVDSFRVRYIVAIVNKHSDLPENNLHLIVYGKKEERAILYELYVEKKNGKLSVDIGQEGTLKKEKGVMQPDEIWGGVGSYYGVKRLLKAISARPAITVSDYNLQQGPGKCTFQE